MRMSEIAEAIKTLSPTDRHDCTRTTVGTGRSWQTGSISSNHAVERLS